MSFKYIRCHIRSIHRWCWLGPVQQSVYTGPVNTVRWLSRQCRKGGTRTAAHSSLKQLNFNFQSQSHNRKPKLKTDERKKEKKRLKMFFFASKYCGEVYFTRTWPEHWTNWTAAQFLLLLLLFSGCGFCCQRKTNRFVYVFVILLVTSFGYREMCCRRLQLNSKKKCRKENAEPPPSSSRPPRKIGSQLHVQIRRRAEQKNGKKIETAHAHTHQHRGGHTTQVLIQSDYECKNAYVRECRCRRVCVCASVMRL